MMVALCIYLWVLLTFVTAHVAWQSGTRYRLHVVILRSAMLPFVMPLAVLHLALGGLFGRRS